MDELQHAIEHADNMALSTVRIQGTNKRHSYKIPFSAVHVIVPHSREEEALLAAQAAGAGGVTMMKAHGMGLDKMDNFYNRLHADSTDSNLMFIVQTKQVDSIIHKVMHDLNLTEDGAGIAYSYPISHMKGVTLKLSDLQTS
jgi:nitrogen regulatory protein PII